MDKEREPDLWTRDTNAHTHMQCNVVLWYSLAEDLAELLGGAVELQGWVGCVDMV